MLVKDFIKWLETQDQEAIVEVLVHSSGTGYYDQGGWVATEEFTKDEEYGCGKHFQYTDLRGNPRIAETEEYFNKRYLQIGSKDN